MIQVKISLINRKRLRKFFSLKGTRKLAEDKKGIHRSTINRILSTGKGNEDLVKKILDLVTEYDHEA